MIEVLKQALDALETEVSIDWTNNDEFNESAEKMHDAITSLRQAIAELESQEPVAWMRKDATLRFADGKMFAVGQPFYTHPPQRTEQEPVAWRTFDGEGQYEYRAYEDNEDYGLWWEERHPNHKNWVEPLYTHPPQRKPLTDEEIVAINDKHYNIAYRDFDADIAIARAIEAAHGIKE